MNPLLILTQLFAAAVPDSYCTSQQSINTNIRDPFLP